MQPADSQTQAGAEARISPLQFESSARAALSFNPVSIDEMRGYDWAVPMVADRPPPHPCLFVPPSAVPCTEGIHTRQRPVQCCQISGRNATLSNALCAFASAEKILWPSVRKCFPGRSFATCAGVAFLHVVDRSSTLFQQYLVYFSAADHHELWHSTSCSARGCGSHS